MEEATVLELQNISKRFGGVCALENINFSVCLGQIHCLLGENGSGKSTLIKIATGALRPDNGLVIVDGRPYPHGITRREALKAGIQAIYQDLALFPNLTAAENITLESFVGEGRRIFDVRLAERQAEAALRQLKAPLVIKNLPVESLPFTWKQITAIARAFTQNARVIFMDEPTASLSWKEVEILFQVIRNLAHTGIGIVLVTHKLNEALSIANYITVLRNGRVITEGPAANFNVSSLSEAMTGRSIATTALTTLPKETASAFEVCRIRIPEFPSDISFSIRRGEIVGLTGLRGSGTQAVAETLFGLRPSLGGCIKVGGREIKIRRPIDAINAGIGYLPEDRLTEGLFLRLSVALNIVAAFVRHLSRRLGIVTPSVIRSQASAMIARLQIRAASPDLPVSALSGGNQQRVVLAKWLLNRPPILILNGPTVGVDVGAKAEIHALLRNLAMEGMSLLIISDDIPELVALCHRVLVMRKGEIVAELCGEEISEARILQEMLT